MVQRVFSYVLPSRAFGQGLLAWIEAECLSWRCIYLYVDLGLLLGLDVERIVLEDGRSTATRPLGRIKVLLLRLLGRIGRGVDPRLDSSGSLR